VYKLIACDIDGTILRSDGSASARTISAMRLAEKCGARVSIATGRRLLSTAPVVAQFAIIQPYVAHCGAVVLDPSNDGVLMAKEIPRQTALDICHLAEARGVDVTVFDSVHKGRALYVTPWKATGVARPVWPRMRPECREVATYAEACSSNPVQLSVQGDAIAIGGLLDELDTLFSNQVSFFDYGILEDGLRVADLFAPGVHKWMGVSFLADMLRIKPGEVVAFGDSMNDAQMLEHAGLGVAMGNSPDELKDLADLVAPPNDEDGVAMVIESLAQRGLLGQ
jgi:hydroxymethylpyrimidine pyrophosphatase-like HAD family hydrolase